MSHCNCRLEGDLRIPQHAGQNKKCLPGETLIVMKLVSGVLGARQSPFGSMLGLFIAFSEHLSFDKQDQNDVHHSAYSKSQQHLTSFECLAFCFQNVFPRRKNRFQFVFIPLVATSLATSLHGKPVFSSTAFRKKELRLCMAQITHV